MGESYYDQHGEAYFAQSLQVDLGPVRARFAAHLRPGAVVCDAGCGSGRDAKAFAEMGFQVTAFDASATLVALARAHTGLPVLHLDFAEVDSTEAWDGLWCCASLLHVPVAQEVVVLTRLRAALRPGGIWYLAFKVGTGERHDGERRFRDHTEASLGDLLARVGGLRILDSWRSPDARPGHAEVWLNTIAQRA